MRIIEIKALDNGAHNNQTIDGVTLDTFPIPDGWAVIRGNEKLENFPFGSFEVETIDGIPYMKEGSWIPGEMPEPSPEPMPEPTTEPSVWDELDAAYQEGVNSAYDE